MPRRFEVTISEPYAQRLELGSWLLAALTTLGGLLTLAGWLFDGAWVKALPPALEPLKGTTGLGFVFGGMALLVGTSALGRRLAAVLAALLMLVGGLGLVEHLLDFDLAFFRNVSSPGRAGRTAPATSVNFVLLGSALLLLRWSWKGLRPSEWLALLCSFSSLLTLTGYLYGVPQLYTLGPSLTSASLHAAVFSLALSVAVLFARPREGLTRFLASDSAGGSSLRRLLPVVILVPILLGWLLLSGEVSAFIDPLMVVALLVLGIVVWFSVLISLDSGALTRADERRKGAELALRDREAYLSVTLDSIGDAVIATDAVGHITRMNPAAERLTGWRLDEARARPLDEVFVLESEAAHQRLEGPFSRVRHQGDLVTSPEGRAELVTRDGPRRPIADSAAPIRSSPGELRGVVLVARDLSDTRRETSARQTAEAALAHKEEQLRQAQKLEAIGLLAGGVAHDFNNLLSVILSYSATLLDELEAVDPRRRDVAEIYRAGERAADLTRQLLAFSRRQLLLPRVVDLRELVRGMEGLLRRLIGEDIELSLSIPEELGRVWADSGQLEQVLMNLVVNARDAMPSGGRLTIELRGVELASRNGSDELGLPPGPWVVLSVTDTGGGMDWETQQRIFEPFFTTKEPGRGTGLGLATVFGIVHQSRGEVRVRSELGKGSRFDVYLPRTGLSPSPRPELPSPSTLRGTETILLVEDEESVRTLISALLRKQGYQVLEAENGGSALLISEQHPGKIHLLLTDVVMPLMSGGQLAERLSAIKPDLKVLFVSGYAERTTAHHGVLREGVAFLQKPITPDVLIRKVRAVLDEAPAKAPTASPRPQAR